MNDVKYLILKLNNYEYSPEVVDEVLKYTATGAIPDFIKGEDRYKKK